MSRGKESTSTTIIGHLALNGGSIKNFKYKLILSLKGNDNNYIND